MHNKYIYVMLLFISTLSIVTSKKFRGYPMNRKFSQSKRTSGESEQHGWISTGSIKQGRESHTSSVLSNGKVLVAGGINYKLVAGGINQPGVTILRSSELYDPSTQTWTTAGNLNHRRADHTVSALLDGKQLVTGGTSLDRYLYLNSAELFDPTTENWTTIEHMHERRSDHVALTLSNGKVLVIGGFCGQNTSRSAELYDPSTGKWTFTGSMASSRVYHTASILSNGKVLVVGGYDSSMTISNACELYDPSTGLWTATSSMNQKRAYHVAVTLLNGKVLVIGGWVGSPTLKGLNSTELYDPLTGVWTMTGSMKYPRISHTASLLSDGNVLVVGGTESSDEDNVYNSSELYNPSTGIWSNAGDMLISRDTHAASLLNNGNVLITGGHSNFDAGTIELRSAELYVPSTNSFTTSDINNTLQLSDKPFI